MLLRRHGRRAGTLAIAALVGSVVSCGPGDGAMSCTDFLEMSAAERGDAFVDAVEDRGVRLAGPDWQVDMNRSVAESFCQQNPSATLDEGLNFAGIPRSR